MTTLTRKQREIASRHTLFLGAARKLIKTEGYATLSMDRIAELAEYSKGTVYQHFSCKEEVLIQLCNHNSVILKNLFLRAAAFEGNAREKVLAIFFAHNLWRQLDPCGLDMMQTLCAPSTKEKVSAESLQTHDALELEIIATVTNIVQAAIEAGDLKLPETVNPVELVFGLWATCHGGIQLQSYDLPLEHIGVRNASNVLLQFTQATLDGFFWKPLSCEYDYLQTIERIKNDCFADECQQTALAKPVARAANN